MKVAERRNITHQILANFEELEMLKEQLRKGKIDEEKAKNLEENYNDRIARLKVEFDEVFHMSNLYRFQLSLFRAREQKDDAENTFDKGIPTE